MNDNRNSPVLKMAQIYPAYLATVMEKQWLSYCSELWKPARRCLSLCLMFTYHSLKNGSVERITVQVFA